jgi:hypothetical protein
MSYAEIVFFIWNFEFLICSIISFMPDILFSNLSEFNKEKPI